MVDGMNTTYKEELKVFYVTYLLVLINAVVFLVMELAGGTQNPYVLIFFGAKMNTLIDAGQYWRLLTSMFIHIGFTHLLFNVYALIALGKLAERLFGHGRFLLIYLFSGLAGSLISYLWGPELSAGASGAIFGLLGAIIIYGCRKPAFWRTGLITNLAIVLGINLVFGVVFSGIDNFAHLGGLFGGAISSALLLFLQRQRQNLH
ncbi:rhomboid family intramembrane serine protease [Dehalobacter sp. 14DCB1]|nr:rhomboid family intramembrane serine protease [Dehalobacter sp. 14DCB1]